jgi:hypothetical protein
MQRLQRSLSVIHLLFIVLLFCSGISYAEDTDDVMPDTEITDIKETSSDIVGLLYNGTVDTKGSLSVLSYSGTSYTVPGNTPIGILQILQEAGTINKLSIGDELMEKKGILLLDGIGNLSFGDEAGWYVKVNGERLEDVVLAETMGLNRYLLNEGDVVLFILGDPKGMVSESKAYLTVTVGEIHEVLAEPVSTNQGNETVKPEQDTLNVTTNEDLPKLNEKTVEEIEKESSPDESDTKSLNTSSTGDQDILYSGSFSLPSGIVNITTTGGDYEIDGDTPLGLLKKLMDDDKISDISVSDKSMRKGGILFLEGINDYHFSGDKTWFVLVNNILLKDYLYPDTDGLNVYALKTGDEVGFYFGEPARPAEDAEAKLIITIE